MLLTLKIPVFSSFLKPSKLEVPLHYFTLSYYFILLEFKVAYITLPYNILLFIIEFNKVRLS